MLIQVPEHFSKSKNILKLSNLSFLYYFNRELTQRVHIQLNQHLLIHVFNGSKNIYAEDKVYKVSAKQSAFISKGQYFMSELLCETRGSFDGIMVFFDDAFILSICNKYKTLTQKEIKKNRKHSSLCVIEKSEALHETMLSTQLYLERKSDESILIQLKFEEIFLQLLQSNKSNEILEYFEALHANSVLKFKSFFEENSFTNVKEMIQRSKLPETQFREIFYELYATTPKEWLLKRALLKAKNLLQDKRLKVTQVAFECGFNSSSWFTKSFKEAFGLTPKKYQQNC